MCGICGIVGDLGDAEVRVKAMMEAMRHRGPDGAGLWRSADGRVTLGHVRLAIQDISEAGAQPMHLGPLSQVVNGEFYNYPALRADMPDAPWRSRCDSEALLHGWAARGADYVRGLDGMFAFALHDGRALTLGRDRMGIKPLYYVEHRGALFFASEVKALIAGLGVSEWTIDRRGLAEFLAYQTPIGARTLFEGVRQVLPGHLLHIPVDAPRRHEETPFWHLRFDPRPWSYDAARSAFAETFRDSVSRHLLSDVPVASYLSAGFDSASVFATACRLGAPLTAFTGRFDMGNDWYDETGPAAEAARAAGAEHVAVPIEAADLRAQLDAVVDALDAPAMGMGAFSQYMVARAAADRFKVILTGHGGDELFAGYPVFRYEQAGLAGIRRLSEAPHFGYFFLSSLRARRAPEYGHGLPVLWSRAEQARMLRGGTVDDPQRDLASLRAPHADPVERITATYLGAYLPGLLVVEDKISMAHSLESRTPILDNALLDLSLSLPGTVKLAGGRLKALVKDNAQGLLPASYFSQPKRGFPTPLRHWLRGPLSKTLNARLKGSEHLASLFRPDALAGFLEAYRRSPARHLRPLDEIQSHRMWQLLALESWLRQWSDRRGVTLRLA